MLEHFLFPQLQDEDDFINDHFFFQQDGATAHTAYDTITLLRQHFPGKLISRKGDTQWPARSPDLTPPDFWLWGMLKHSVYSTPIRDLEHLEQRISEEIGAITAEERQSALLSFEARLQKTLDIGGRHIE